MKIKITGASDFTNRMFEACGNYQWAREFLKNSLEAGATQVEFGIEWQAVEKRGVYRRTIMDNGSGMTAQELLDFFSTLGVGAKKIGGVHDNFGVGAKIASLPWNPDGVVVISYKASKASMIWIMLEPDSGDYELVEFQSDGKTTCVIDPQRVGEIEGMEWSAICPPWIKEHGTIVVLLGKEGFQDTVLGNPEAGEKDTKGLSVYLNTRFWDLTSVTVKVDELRHERKNDWPRERNDKERPTNNRTIKGARFYLTDPEAKTGKLGATSSVELDKDRVKAEWYLWEGDRPKYGSYAKEVGYIAVRYKDELFHLTSSKVAFRWFGIIEGKVQRNLTIILEPMHYKSRDGVWGVHPDQSRNRLIFSGNGEKGVDLPMSDWGSEFASEIPEPILKAIHDARGDINGTIDDAEYRKRLADKFGERWRMKRFVLARPNDKDARPATPTDEDVDALITVITDGPGPGQGSGPRPRPYRRTVKVIRKRAEEDGTELGVDVESPIDVPKYRFASAGSFERPWHLALWAPKDPDGPTVILNRESSILQEVVEYHQEQYPDHMAEEVGNTVRQVFGEVAVSKVAHSEKLTKRIATEELDKDYRNEQALTIALMGLLAEETVISQRLGKFGRKKGIPQAIPVE